MALTNKQRAFVEYYLGEAQWNATEAARRAGYRHPHSQASRVLSNVGVQRYIAARQRDMKASTEALVRRWIDRMLVDISPYMFRDGLDLEALKQAGLGYLIKGYRKTKDGVTILLRDPDVAETNLARRLQMFVERHEHSGVGGGPIEHKGSRDLTGLTDEELGVLGEIARRAMAD